MSDSSRILATLEWFLARFTTRARANAAIGDLFELSKGCATLSFFASYVRVLAAAAWPRTAAWFGSYAVGCAVLYLLSYHHPQPPKTLALVSASAVSPVEPLQAFSACFVLPCIFGAAYLAARFGLRSRLTQLVLLLAAADAAMILLVWVPVLNYISAFFVPAVLVAALALRPLRRAFWTVASASAAAMLSFSLVWVTLMRFQFTGDVSKDMHLYLLLNVSGLGGLWCFTALCVRMQGKTLRADAPMETA